MAGCDIDSDDWHRPVDGYRWRWVFLADGEWKPLILAATYIVVIFSMIVQGLTVARLAERVGRAPELM
jgi:hypothetical protein